MSNILKVFQVIFTFRSFRIGFIRGLSKNSLLMKEFSKNVSSCNIIWFGFRKLFLWWLNTRRQRTLYYKLLQFIYNAAKRNTPPPLSFSKILWLCIFFSPPSNNLGNCFRLPKQGENYTFVVLCKNAHIKALSDKILQFRRFRYFYAFNSAGFSMGQIFRVMNFTLFKNHKNVSQEFSPHYFTLVVFQIIFAPKMCKIKITGSSLFS